MSHRRTYETAAIRVHWESALCIHTGRCLQALPQVFDVNRRPWVDVQAAEADAIADAVERCPTSALRYERLDGAPQEQPKQPTMILPIEDGPLLMMGDLDVRDADGESIAHETRLTLCRCGMSRNQPFCDNSHLRRDWRSGPTTKPNEELPPTRDTDRPTTITAKRDASLDLRGHLRIYHSDGRPLAEGGRALFCRCGKSQNKPFCDGSHETAEFRSRPPATDRDRLEADSPAAFTPNRRVPDPQAL